MNQHLQTILNFIQQSKHLSDEEKTPLSKAAKAADKELEITSFKLDRTEKVKRTTAILLEETIEELEQKRKAVETQNRELEIESSLERVRTVAMGMKKPGDLLNICEVLFKELQALGFGELRNALIHTFVDEQNYFFDYDYSDFTGGCISRIPYSGHPVIEKFIKDIRKKNDAFSEIEVTGKELEEWKRFRKDNGEADDPRLDNIESLYYYNYSVGAGGIGISTYTSINTEKQNLLKRFRNVFDLAYKRYTDITKAEAQAREAQIEAALERVRSRTMGMQKSEELKEIIQVVYEQFVHLNILVEHAGFIMDYKARDDMHIWLADKHEVPFQVTIPYFDCAHWNSFNEAKEKGLDFFANHLTFEEKNRFYQDLFKLIPGLPEEAKEYYFSCPGLAISTVLLENVGLYIENFSGIFYSDEENTTLMRFGKVFQQTYTRFLDLQKAEAQAKESQIQLALERVRARTMAMQKSDELQDAAIILFQQIKSLGVQTGSCGFNIWNKDKKATTVWMSSAEGGLQVPFKMPHTESAIYKPVYAAMKNGEDFLVKEVGGKILKKHFDYLLTLPGIGDVIKHLRETSYAFPEKMVYHFAFFNNGYLSFHLHEHHPETHNIFKRFTKVFEQTYTRFLDLQKAEAQAREAQIEVALERVRSKAMAMQKSEDLAGAVVIVFEELNKLNIGILRCGIGILDKNKRTADVFTTTISDNNSIMQVSGDVPMDIHPLFHNAFEAWLKQQDCEYVLKGEDLNNYYKALTNVNFNLPQSQSLVTADEKLCNIITMQYFLMVDYLLTATSLLMTKQEKY